MLAKKIKISLEAANQSGLISGMKPEKGAVIHLELDSKTLKKIVAMMEEMVTMEDMDKIIKEIAKKDRNRYPKKLPKIYKLIVNDKPATLLNLINAADYMNIIPLLELLSYRFAYHLYKEIDKKIDKNLSEKGAVEKMFYGEEFTQKRQLQAKICERFSQVVSVQVLIKNRFKKIQEIASVINLKYYFGNYIEKLYLENMPARSFSLEDFFEFLPNLNELHLSNSSISSINFLTDLQNLKILDLSYNKLEDISNLQQLKKLEKLDLSGNLKLKDISPLEQLPELRELQIHAKFKNKIVEKYENTINALINKRVNVTAKKLD